MEFNGINIDTFLVECEDNLQSIEALVLAQRDHAPDQEAIHALFRSFHTLKGASAMVGFEQVAAFTHSVENVLDRLRHGQLAFTQQLREIILAAKDRVSLLIAATVEGTVAAADENLAQQLRALTRSEPDPRPSIAPTFRSYSLRFAPRRTFTAADFDLVALLTQLRALGTTRVHVDASAVPPLSELDLERCYLAWDITIMSDCAEQAVRDAFLFAPADAELELSSQPERGVVLFDDAEPQPEPAAPPPPPAAKASAPAEAKTASRARESVVRVASQKLDQLVALVGELVIGEARLRRVADRIGDVELSEPVEDIQRLVVELRESVLGVRMMPIGSAFARFQRLVHDLSSQLGKPIELVTAGAETELDKDVLDRLVEPLLHLIRNSLDHGIEPAADRSARNKPAQGTIQLTAEHVGQHVVIKLSDDGRGLDGEAIRAKAIERGLIAPEQTLAPSELHKLIFLPGFSTAKKVTDVSGRGVGMDVVKRQIDALRGSVSISSEIGVGTTISLSLPVTLAIIDGLLVELAGERYIIAHGSVSETVELDRGDSQRHNGRCAVAVRGQLVPYIRLREAFGLHGEDAEHEKVVIVEHADERVGLVVDRVLGGHQTVIQGLGRMYRQIEVVSGATITGDGRVALILNIDGIVRSCARTEGRASEARVA